MSKNTFLGVKLWRGYYPSQGKIMGGGTTPPSKIFPGLRPGPPPDSHMDGAPVKTIRNSN